MTVSVCMCTFQGEKYIQKQLDSIYEQTKRPDEVIICDDGSDDRTLPLIEDFIQKHHLEGKWNLRRNPENLGYLANFYYACSLCTGDIVFFADQDDVWYPEKLEKMYSVFEQQKNAKVVCCKFGLIDAEGNKISGITAPVRTKESAAIKPLSIESVFRKCEWPAMVLAFRQQWFQEWKEMTKGSGIPHDYLFCAKAAEEEGLYQLDLELASHRLHGDNVAKEEHRLSFLLRKDRKMEEIKEYLENLEAFEREKVLRTDRGRRALEEKKQMMRDRQEVLLSGKIGRVFHNWIKYGRKIRLATVICDLWIVKQKNGK